MTAEAGKAADWAYLSEIMKTLGHPIRLQIIAILCEQDANPKAMAEELRASQGVVSQQLSILRMRGLVSKSRLAGRAVYTLEETRLRLLIQCVRGCRKPVLESVSAEAAS